MIDTTLWTALVTPMKESGEVHFGDMETLIRRQESAGNGVLLMGSTGEGIALDESEKRGIVQFAEELEPATPLMAGVGGFQLEKQKDWIKFCNKFRMDAYLLVAPLYSRPGKVGLVRWFRDLMDVAEKPCMIYNIPSRTGVKIPSSVLKELENHPNFWSVKEAGGSLKDYRVYRESVPAIPLYSGDDGLMPGFAAAGCAGLVSVVSNVWPGATSRYVDLCLGETTESHFPVWEKAIEALFLAPNPIPVKLLLHHKGIIETKELRPPLTADEVQSIAQLVEADREVANWYKNNK